GPDSGRVGAIELFFDLVFAFAVTQLSHALLADLTGAGALRVAFLLFAVWWVWIYTSWVTNWLDPERPVVRLALLVLMLAGLVLAVTLPGAFGARGLVFAGAYVFMQVGRTIFMLWALADESQALHANFRRILVWFALSAVFWLAGGISTGATRFLSWTLALAIDLIGPLAYFRVPGLGRSSAAEWNIDPGHMAERCGLFVIIALGESLLITGATFTTLDWSASGFAAFVVAMLGSVAMWWLYFDTGAGRGHHAMAHAALPGRIARLAYTYLHVLIIAGIIVCAVADEIALVHPGHASGPAIAAIVGGPAIYVLGNALFKWVTNKRPLPPLSHVAGLVLLALLMFPALQHALTALQLSALTTGILVMVATWERKSLS
ncbi:MAG TPA: low temperature requirement protein A, partial [Steroidobacteraceae bacterium]|nr:low temperature requirement protein A [Steroidobacteraceae bacterium]